MPQLIIKGLAIDKVKDISKVLVDDLQAIIGCPREYFTIEAVNSLFIMDGLQTKITPLVQVNWFDRGQEVQDKAAAAIYRRIQDVGYNDVEIFFIVLEEKRYYENGVHY